MSSYGNLFIYGGVSVPILDSLTQKCVVSDAIADIVKKNFDTSTEKVFHCNAAHKLQLLNYTSPTAQKIIEISREQDVTSADGSAFLDIFYPFVSNPLFFLFTFSLFSSGLGVVEIFFLFSHFSDF